MRERVTPFEKQTPIVEDQKETVKGREESETGCLTTSSSQHRPLEKRNFCSKRYCLCVLFLDKGNRNTSILPPLVVILSPVVVTVATPPGPLGGDVTRTRIPPKKKTARSTRIFVRRDTFLILTPPFF